MYSKEECDGFESESEAPFENPQTKVQMDGSSSKDVRKPDLSESKTPPSTLIDQETKV